MINGSKMYITNSLQADWLCVLARTSDEGGYAGMSQIVVPTDAPGFEVTSKLDKLGMRASDTGLLRFDDCRVPVANTIGIEGMGFQQQMAQFVDETDVGQLLVGRRLERALQTHRRLPAAANRLRQATPQEPVHPVQAGRTRGGSRHPQALQLRMRRGVHAGRGHHPVRHDRQDQGGPLEPRGRRLVRAVPRGIGYMEDTWTARFMRDTRLTAIGGGSDETMLQVLARLDGYWI